MSLPHMPEIPAAAPPRRLNDCAIASAVFGAAGLLMPVGFSLLAIYLGRRAHRQIDARGGRPADRDLASTGIAMGWLGTAFTLAVVACVAVLLVGSVLLAA